MIKKDENNNCINSIISNPKYAKRVYNYGFLITNDDSDSIISKVNVLSQWILYNKNNYCFIIHPSQKIVFAEKNQLTFYLIGHAYNPFDMISDEQIIIDDLARAWEIDESAFYERLNNLTGIFVIGYVGHQNAYIVGDTTGLQTVFYGKQNRYLYISSHTQLIGDALQLEMDDYIKHLVNYRLYRIFGKMLPGDLTPFHSFKRVIPNHYVKYENGSFSVSRFFPIKDYQTVDTAEEYNAVVDQVAEFMHNNLKLIAEKWSRPAISCTGGCDSKTTLSCANGLYDKFICFSYISSKAEKADAEAAHKICAAIDKDHNIYNIPSSDSEVENVELVRSILQKNTGYIGKDNRNDVRKRAIFADINDFDVEVKSWVSEIGRASFYKEYSKKSFPKNPTPHYLTSLYKVFLADHKLTKQTDAVFSDYINTYMTENELHNYPWLELFDWEFITSSWGGITITGEQKYSFDITVPYNNRKILELLLCIPLKQRITDDLYKDVRKKMNPAIDATGIHVVDIKLTKTRAIMERIYLEICSRIPL